MKKRKHNNYVIHYLQIIKMRKAAFAYCLLLISLYSKGQVKNNPNVGPEERWRQNLVWLKMHRTWENKHLDTLVDGDNIIKKWSDGQWVYSGHDHDSIFHRAVNIQTKSGDGDTAKCWIRVIYYEKKIASKVYKDVTTYQLYQVACKGAMMRIIQNNMYSYTGDLITSQTYKNAEWSDWRPDNFTGVIAESICNFSELKP